MVDEKLKMLNERVRYAQSCWSPRKRYEEALRSFRWIDGELDRLSPRKDSDVQSINAFAAGFHTVYGHLLRTIGMEEEGREHLERAYDLHFGSLSHSFALHFELPIPDLLTAKRELLTDWKKQMDCLPYASVPYSVSESALRLADRLFEEGLDEEARETLLLFLDFVKEAEDDWDEEWPLMAPEGALKPSECLILSHAHELLGRGEEARSYLERAGEAAVATIEWVEEREKNIHMKALAYEEAGSVFERLDPRKALEHYDLAEKLYAEAMMTNVDPYEYESSFYDLEFLRQLGHLWPLFRFDTFARLALRRQRLLAVIDGEAGYPLRREPRSVR